MPRNRTRYPEKLLPSRARRAEWRAVGLQRAAARLRLAVDDELVVAEAEAYARRWLKFWKDTLDTLRDQGSWDDRDLGQLDEYVKWNRQAEDHRAAAEAAGYQEHAESGRVFAHPGFALERAARQEARVLARMLLLDPEARYEAGLEDDEPEGGDGAPENDQAGL